MMFRIIMNFQSDNYSAEVFLKGDHMQRERYRYMCIYVLEIHTETFTDETIRSKGMLQNNVCGGVCVWVRQDWLSTVYHS